MRANPNGATTACYPSTLNGVEIWHYCADKNCPHHQQAQAEAQEK